MIYTYLNSRAEYEACKQARMRCRNASHAAYENYGGRGITFCDEWLGKGGFQKFMEHIGPKPSPELSLDRIDNDKGYEPGNVRWATASEQMLNRRPSVHKYWFHYEGQLQPLSVIASKVTVKYYTLLARVRRSSNPQSVIDAL